MLGAARCRKSVDDSSGFVLVNLDYRDKQGNRSTRAIEAYSLRRSRAGEVLLMAVRAEDGQPRSYLVNSILGVSPTQTTFSPRYPIELALSGSQLIPERSQLGGVVVPQTSARRRSKLRATGSNGPTYVFRCPGCCKLFERKTYDATLRPHKNHAGYQ
jgi:hypothetical protein